MDWGCQSGRQRGLPEDDALYWIAWKTVRMAENLAELRTGAYFSGRVAHHWMGLPTGLFALRG